GSYSFTKAYCEDGGSFLFCREPELWLLSRTTILRRVLEICEAMKFYCHELFLRARTSVTVKNNFVEESAGNVQSHKILLSLFLIYSPKGSYSFTKAYCEDGGSFLFCREPELR
ncbi:hypothetical protein Anas_02441, partial [Armadillidium nasatum]